MFPADRTEGTDTRGRKDGGGIGVSRYEWARWIGRRQQSHPEKAEINRVRRRRRRRRRREEEQRTEEVCLSVSLARPLHGDVTNAIRSVNSGVKAMRLLPRVGSVDGGSRTNEKGQRAHFVPRDPFRRDA